MVVVVFKYSWREEAVLDTWSKAVLLLCERWGVTVPLQWEGLHGLGTGWILEGCEGRSHGGGPDLSEILTT